MVSVLKRVTPATGDVGRAAVLPTGTLTPSVEFMSKEKEGTAVPIPTLVPLSKIWLQTAEVPSFLSK